MSTKKDDALKLALEALEAHADIGIKADKAITAIREALAEQPAQQQEPVGYCVDAVAWEAFIHDYDRYISGNPNYPWQNIREGLAAVIESVAPASKPWVGLTLKETTDIELSLRQYHNSDSYDLSLSDYARAIEAKLREKNNG